MKDQSVFSQRRKTLKKGLEKGNRERDSKSKDNQSWKSSKKRSNLNKRSNIFNKER